MNPTNVRRNDSSCNSSVHSSFRSQTRPQVQKKLSCAEKMALDSPESPQSPKKSERRKISAPATLDSRPGTSCTQLEEPTIQAEKTKVPCEFCNEPCSLEALMRHQVTRSKAKGQRKWKRDTCQIGNVLGMPWECIEDAFGCLGYFSMRGIL